MALVIATCRGRVYATLNAAPTTFGTLADPRWTATEVDTALLAADGKVIEAICSNKNHPRRKAFLTGTASDVAHGASLTSRIGPLESVTCVVTGGSYAGTYSADEWPVERLKELERDNRNPDALTSLKPAVILDGDTIWHNKAALLAGGASSVSFNTTFCVYTNNGSTLQAPDENEDDVVDEAMKMLRAKEGHHVEAAGYHARLATEDQERIRNLPSGPRPVSESP